MIQLGIWMQSWLNAEYDTHVHHLQKLKTQLRCSWVQSSIIHPILHVYCCISIHNSQSTHKIVNTFSCIITLEKPGRIWDTRISNLIHWMKKKIIATADSRQQHQMISSANRINRCDHMRSKTLARINNFNKVTKRRGKMKIEKIMKIYLSKILNNLFVEQLK